MNPPDPHATRPVPLEEQRARALDVLEHGDPCYVLDSEFRYVLVNAAQERSSGRSRAETLGRVIWDVWPAAANRQLKFWDVYHRVMRERAPEQFEEYFEPLDLWVEVQVYPASEDGIAVFFRRINERKRAEEAVRRTEELLRRQSERERAINENLIDMLWMYRLVRDADGSITDWRIVDANPVACESLGLRRGDLLGRTARELVPERWPDLRSIMERVHATGVAERYESVFRGHGLLNTAFRVDADTVALATLDITHLRESEAATRASERKYRTLAENSPEVIARFDRQLRHTYVNAHGERVFGLPRARIVGRTTADLGLRADTAAFWDEHLERVFRNGREETIDFEFDSPALGHQHFSSLLVPEIGDHTEVESVLAITRDVTNLRRTEQALRESEQRKDEFLGMLSHELRNPLAPIWNSLHLLEQVPPTGDQARRSREIITRQVRHLSRLVDDLLDMTRIARGKIELRLSTIDLMGVVQRACEDYRASFDERRVQLVPPGGAPLWVRGDETRLAQVIGNLLHNAAKFTPAGGRAELTASRCAGDALVVVRDTGAGIAPEAMAQIFEPFTQAKQKLARTEGGLGLGLALVKGLVELHGGSVHATSLGPDRGSEFVLRIPLATAAPGGRAPAPSAAGSAPSRRVLVVDDNVDSVTSLAEVIQLLGHAVDVAFDGREALEKIEQVQPDVVLCDIGLPGMDGYEVARAIRTAGRSLTLVAVTGYAQPDDVRRAAEAGFDAHIAKPADPDHVRRLLERGRPA